LVNGSIFELTNPRNFKTLDDGSDDREDLENMLNFTLKSIKRKYGIFKQLRSAYRKFDASRGLEYILDLEFTVSLHCNFDVFFCFKISDFHDVSTFILYRFF